MRASVFAILLAACGARVDTADDDGPAGIDAAVADAPSGADAGLGLWGTPTPIGPAATAALEEDDGTLDGAETELVFAARVPGGLKHLYALTRPTRLDPWTGTAALIPGVNSAQTDHTPRLSADGQTLYFSSNRPGGLGSHDIWMTTRGAGGGWAIPTLVPGVSSPQSDRTFTPCAGNRYLMISFPNGNGDVFEGVLGAGPPTMVASLSHPTAGETGTFVTADCLEIWFASERDGDADIFHGHRAAVTDPWILDGKVTELSTTGAGESDPWVSADGHRMIFASDVDGAENDQYQVSR